MVSQSLSTYSCRQPSAWGHRLSRANEREGALGRSVQRSVQSPTSGASTSSRSCEDLNFHLPTDLDEVVRRDQKEIHGVDRIAQHECEEPDAGAGEDAVGASRDDSIAGVEEDRVVQVDRAT